LKVKTRALVVVNTLVNSTHTPSLSLCSLTGLETIGACVDMLRCFEVLTKKEAVRKALEKKTEGTLILFHSQIADSRSRFDRNRLSPTLMDDEPTFAGAASWARGMKRRIEHDWALLQQARPWLPKVSESFGVRRWCCVHQWV